jgi:large subunit ribosomal protein L4
MVALPIYNVAGKNVGSYEIDPSAIAPSINKQLLHDVVVMYQANLRQGSHCAKSRGEVSGHKKKMYRQKGTGNARAGHKRTNIRRGGGTGHTIKPRDYSYSMNRKAVKLATRMAIAAKIADNEVVVLDKFDLTAPKTKQVAGFLKALKFDGSTTLIATAGLDHLVYMSARNIEGVSVSAVRDLNALSVLKPRRIVVMKDALDKIKDGSFAEPLASV